MRCSPTAAIKIEPYYIDRIEGPGGQIVYSAEPRTVCAECAQPVKAVSDAERAKNAASQRDDRAADTARARARGTRPPAQVISPQVCFLMNDIMKDVITRGTGRRALALGRADLRGKTGTTNESVDTWFNGFNDSLVASVWVGSDDNRPLGEGEEGAPHGRADLGGLHARSTARRAGEAGAPFPKESSR